MARMLAYLSIALQFTIAVAQHQQKINVKVISGSGISACPLQEARRVAVAEMNNDVFGIL